MKFDQREHPQARAELRDAAHWYEDREPGLGDDLHNAIDEAIARIVYWPDSAPVFPGWVDTPIVRSMAVDAFPYRVLYYVTETRFTILAYAHQRRKPGYWQHRFGS